MTLYELALKATKGKVLPLEIALRGGPFVFDSKEKMEAFLKENLIR